jgi:hypothetical protein
LGNTAFPETNTDAAPVLSSLFADGHVATDEDNKWTEISTSLFLSSAVFVRAVIVLWVK